MREDRTMKRIINNLFSKLAVVVILAMAFSGTALGQISINFENNAIPTGWTNTNDMAVVSNPISNTSATNGSYCLSTNGKASNSLTSGYIENIVSISVDATRTSTNTTNEVYIDFCPNTSFGSSDTQTQSVTVNRNSWTTSTLTLSNTASGYVRIRRSGGNSTATKFIDNIVITQQSGGSSLTTSDLAITNAPVALSFDLYNNATAQTVSFTTSSTGAISVSESEYIDTSISENTITVTPKKVTSSAQTITIYQAADATYAAGSATFTVSVTDTTPYYNVTYKANGGTGNDIERSYKKGTNVTVEANTFTRAGYKFTKWNTEADGQGIDYLPEATITSIEQDIDLYAQWEESNESIYDFTQIDGFSSWGNSYSDHTVTYSDAKITFNSASKQTGTITNQPVTKGGDVSLVITDGSTIKSASFVCTQWSDKAQTITLHYSTNGGSSYTSTGVTSSNFTISKDNLPEGTNAVKITFSSSSNQVGIASASIDKIDPTPTISADNVNIACSDTGGSIDFRVINPVDGGEISASVNVSWLTLGEIGEESIPFTCDTNTSDERTATVTLTYTYNDQTVNKEVTITQAEYVTLSTWIKTTLDALTSNDVFVIVGNNGNNYALPNNGETSAPTAVATTISGDSWNGIVAENLLWNVSGNADDGYVFCPNGSTTTWLYCNNANNGVRVGTGDAKHFKQEDGYLTTKETTDQRYIGIYSSQDWRCYTVKDGNIADQTFTFYKKATPNGAAAQITINATLNNGRYWATFYNGVAQYSLPDGAQAFTMNADHQLYLLGTDGSIVPERTAVVIIADQEEIILTQKNAGTAEVFGNKNILKGSDDTVAKSGLSGTPYVLGIVDNKLGFYEFAGTTIPAKKAYYIVK